MDPSLAASTLNPWEPGVFALVVFALLIAAAMGVILFLSAWLNPTKSTPTKEIPYECSITPTGEARFQYPTPFYLVAAFFLIFDVEAVYVFSWAVSFDKLTWGGWFQITFFIGVLLLSLVYVWRKGGLEWGANPMR
jgi:NADH-quinone oxidoreductase subunit A